MPPRSVLAFANYFSETVLGGAFEVRPEHAPALTNLTHSLIFRRVQLGFRNFVKFHEIS